MSLLTNTFLQTFTHTARQEGTARADQDGGRAFKGFWRSAPLSKGPHLE